MANDVTRELRLKMDTKEAVNSLGLLETATKAADKAVKDLEKAGQKGTEEHKKAKIALDEARKAQDAHQKSMKLSEMSYTQLTNFVNKMGKAVRDETAIETAAGKEKIRIWQAALTEQAKQTKMMDEIRGKAVELAKPGIWNSIKDAVTNAFAIVSIDRAVTFITNFGREAVLAAAKASDAFGGIAKTTGMTTEEVIDLDKAIRKIDTRTAQADLLKIAQVGGQIGVVTDEMLGFVQSVDMAVVALGDEFSGGAEEVAGKLGVLSKLFVETKELKAGEAIDQIGSAINELGAAGSATGPVVADFATRLGQLGKLAPSISQTLGLGAALQELGLTAEIAAGGLSNILLGSAKATALFAAQINETEEGFKKLLDTDPNEVILRLAASFKGLPIDVVVKQMDDLGIKSQEATKVMMLLSDQTDDVKKKQELSRVSMQDARIATEQLANGYAGLSEDQKVYSSLTKEFNTMNNTAAAMLDKAGKAVDSLKIQLGTYLLPIVIQGTAAFVSFIKVLGAIPEFVKENQKLFTALGVAMIALNGNNIKATASAIAHSAAEKARAIIARTTAAAQVIQNIALEALQKHNERSTSTTYLHIAAEKIRTTVTNTVASAKAALRAIMAALTVENIKNTASSTASAVAERARAIVTNTVTGAQTALRAITSALTLENIRSTATTVAATVAEKARTIATNTVVVAQGLLNAAMRANPIGVVITLIGALVAVLVTWYNNSQTLRATINGLWTVMKDGWNFISNVFEPGISGVSRSFSLWKSVIASVSDYMAQVFGPVMMKFGGVFDYVKGKIDVVKNALGSFVSGVSTAISGAANVLDKFTGGALSATLEYGNKVAKSFAKGYQEQIDKENPKIVAAHKKTVNDKATESEVAAKKAAAAEKKAAQDAVDAAVAANAAGHDTITKEQQKALDKRTRANQKYHDDLEKAEKKYDERIQKDREKALELAAQMEAENDKAIAETTLEIEEIKIREKARKRLKDIEHSTIDEKQKAQLIEAVNKNSEAALDKAKEEFREKQLKKDQEAAKKRLENEKFILDQEEKATATYYDWRELNARGNANALAAIQKKRVDEELELIRKKLAFEMQTEKAQASAIATSKEEEGKLHKAIDDRFQREGLIAFKESADKKLEIDRSLYEKKVNNIRNFHDAFKGMLSGNLNNLITAVIDMVAVSKKGNEDETASMQEKFEKYAAAAQAAVNFLNGLAQERARVNIEAAKKELAERTAVLEQEIAITEAMHEATSDYITKLKDTETDRVNALEASLTSGTETELDKRAAASRFYSNQLEMLKQAEENKIAEMQRMANLAKTDDEKQAIEAKIALARQEADEKIRLAREEMDRSIAANNRLVDLQRTLTSETSTEAEKRAALQESYSILLQNLKEQEEARITDLHRQANEAKTADEKAALEAKIAMAQKERDEKIRLMEQERDAKTETLTELDVVTKQLSEKQLADAKTATEKQISMAEEEAEQKAAYKEDLEAVIAAENRKARATEISEKKKAFAAQKKADVATALITGALAVLKALANFFPLNIILAATAGVVTGVQIAKIKNQPEPSFEQGGFVARGGKHGSSYGDGGIALIDRQSGREVGEMEGDEAIVSAKQTEANWPIIQKMFSNARTPGRASTPVIQHPAVPMAFRNGGVFESPYFERGMYLFGSKKRKAEQAARDAEAEAAKAQAEADAAMGDMGFDGSAYGGIDGTDPASMGDTASAQQAHAAAQKQGQDQLKAIEENLEVNKANGVRLDKVISMLSEVKGATNGVEGATYQVRDAVNHANTQGKFDQLIAAVSAMSA